MPLENDEKRKTELYDLLLEACRKNQLAKALQCCNELINYFNMPDTQIADLYYQRAEIYKKLMENSEGKPEEAMYQALIESDLNQAIDKNSNKASFYAARAMNPVAAKTDQQKLTDLKMANQLEPQNAYYQLQLEQIMVKLHGQTMVTQLVLDHRADKYLDSSKLELESCTQEINALKKSRLIAQVKFGLASFASTVAVGSLFVGIGIAAVLPMLVPVWAVLIGVGGAASLFTLPFAMRDKRNLNQINRQLTKLHNRKQRIETNQSQVSSSPYYAPPEQRITIYGKTSTPRQKSQEQFAEAPIVSDEKASSQTLTPANT